MSDGEREPEYAIMNGWLVEAEAGCTCYGGGPYGHEPGCGYAPVANIEKALEDAGYRNRPMPSVEEVLGIADNITARRSIGLYSGLSDNTRRIANAAAREAATAVLALFTKESE